MSVELVTLAVGQRGRDMLAISGPVLQAWATKLRAGFTVIDRAPEGYALAGKFHLTRIVERNDRTIFVDADTVPNLAAMPSILDLVPVDFVGMHDDFPRLGEAVVAMDGWAGDLYRELHESQGWTCNAPPRQIWNTGVIVASRQHAAAFAPPKQPFPAEHCAEQFLIQIALERAGIPIFGLDERWNYQWWFNRRMPTLRERPDLFIRHFAGTSQPAAFGTTHKQRIAMMRAAVRELEGKPSREGRRCLHLGRRTEKRAGCATGYGCRHECEKGHRAIPATTCQKCSDFDDDGQF